MVHKRHLRILLVVFLMLLTFPQAALAGSWWKVSATDPITTGTPEWRDFVENSGYSSPHGGYTTSSNLCKTCHAVHDAGANSYRLLKSGVTDFEAGADRTAGELRGEVGSFVSVEGAGDKRSTECMYCHDSSSGLTDLRPYALSVLGATVRGEHTLGATSVPDSDINGGVSPSGILPDRNRVVDGGDGAELDCYQCHSVHGANTIGHDVDHDGNLDPVGLDNNIYDGNDNIESWNTKILRVDPSGDGNPLALGTGGMDAGELASEPTAVRTGFCADCHNRNPNWVTATDTVGPNKTSHVQGRGADGLLEIYGTADVAVAGHKSEAQGCRGCHAASDSAVADSRFPHQSVGWKLMWDSYDDTGTADLAGDPNRSLPVMDKACLMCHPMDDEFETGKGYSDVSTEQLLCFRCHRLNSFAGAPDVQTEMAKANRHPTSDSSGLHVDDTSETQAQLGGANRHAECIDCHNVETVLQGQGKPLKGIWGVSVANGSAGTAPTYTKVEGVTMEYELCFKCHSSYVTQRSNTTYSGASPIYEYPIGTDLGQGDKGLEFNLNNNAFHPVEGAGRNGSANLDAQLVGAGLSTGSVIKCSDCHNSDETSDVQGPAGGSSFDPRGPHGSDNRPILRANYALDYETAERPTSWNASNFGLCFLCHDETALTAETIALGARTNFYKNGALNRNLHWVHVKDLLSRPFPPPTYSEQLVCRNCHYNVHSNQQAPRTIYWYWPAAGAGWVSGSTPPAGVKTHLVNFSPDIEAQGGGGKGSWFINLDSVSHNTILPGNRACSLRCHMQKGGAPADKEMDVSSFYYDPPSGDDVPTYTP